MAIVQKSQLSKLFTNHKWQIPHICIYGNCDIYTEGSDPFAQGALRSKVELWLQGCKSAAVSRGGIT